MSLEPIQLAIVFLGFRFQLNGLAVQFPACGTGHIKESGTSLSWRQSKLDVFTLSLRFAVLLLVVLLSILHLFLSRNFGLDLRLGGTTLRMETPALPDGPAGVSDRGYGGEVGAGIYIGAWNAVALNPGVRFTAIGTRLPGGADLGMRFLVADLGLSLAF